MKETKVIRVIGKQKNVEGEQSEIELTTEGVLYEKNNHIYIVYEETELSGMEGTTTTLKIESNKRVSITRFGSTKNQLIFEEGESYKTLYNTMYGNFPMEVFTNYLSVNLDEQNKGVIEIRYDLNVADSMEPLVNKLKIELM